MTIRVSPDFLHIGPLGMAALFGGVVGAVNGLLFALFLMASQRGRSVAQPSRVGFAVAGAAASAIIGGLVFQDVRGTAVAGLLGAAAAAAMLWARATGPQRKP